MKTKEKLLVFGVGLFALVMIVLGCIVANGQFGMSAEEKAYHEAVEQVEKALEEMPTFDYESAEESDIMDEVPDGWTLEQYQAALSACDWLDCMPLSKEGLTECLLNDGFSNEAVTFVMDNIIVDWNEQALLSAEDWLDCMPLSKAELTECLIDDGFTEEEAQYAVDTLYGTDEPAEASEPVEEQTVEEEAVEAENESYEVTEASEPVEEYVEEYVEEAPAEDLTAVAEQAIAIFDEWGIEYDIEGVYENPVEALEVAQFQAELAEYEALYGEE